MISTDHFHPMSVHFPIALITIGFLADLISLIVKKEICFPKMSFYLLIIGTFGVMAAVLTGVLFTSEMTGTAGEAKENHELMAYITLSVLVLTSILRIIQLKKSENKTFKFLAFLFYTIAAACVGLTGALGGTLVYNYMLPI